MSKQEDVPPTTVPAEPTIYEKNTKNMIFGIIIFLYEIALCVIFSTVYGFGATAFQTVADYGGVLLVSVLTILMIVGMDCFIIERRFRIDQWIYCTFNILRNVVHLHYLLCHPSALFHL